MGWPIWVSMVAQAPVTVTVLIIEVQKPTYHGVFSRQINAKHIDRYLRGEIP